MWVGNWLGLYNTWESFGGQLLAATIVLGTWRVARFKAKRRSAKRRAECKSEANQVLSSCDPEHCELMQETAPPEKIVQVRLPSRAATDAPVLVKAAGQEYSDTNGITDDDSRIDARAAGDWPGPVTMPGQVSMPSASPILPGG